MRQLHSYIKYMFESGDDTTGFHERISFSFGPFQVKNYEEECQTDLTQAISLDEVQTA